MLSRDGLMSLVKRNAEKPGFSFIMSKKIGALLALSIAFGAGGAQSASISEARLKQMMSSTATEAVLLETLRARDKEVLTKLAGSLADRYADLLAGSELVFTRLVEDGNIFYRLDFANLRNRDRARALCHILEMERCIARIGADRMVVLDVEGEDAVTAIARMERETEEDLFTIAMREPDPAPNPLAREVEAKSRKTLDPLTAFPEPRPENLDQIVAETPTSPEVPPALQPVTPQVPGADAMKADPAGGLQEGSADPADEAGLFPIPRHDALAGLEQDVASVSTTGRRSSHLDASAGPIMSAAALARADGIEVAATFDQSDDRITNAHQHAQGRVARVMADISTEKRLGRVVFDDQYARPAQVDFSGGSESGDLQKLPIRRDRALSDEPMAPASSAPIEEVATSRDNALLTSRPTAPFEVAQVPGVGSPPSPEATARDAARSQLSSLLSGADGEITEPEAPQPDAEMSEEQIFATPAASGSRPGLDMPSEPEPAPVNPSTSTRPGVANPIPAPAQAPVQVEIRAPSLPSAPRPDPDARISAPTAPMATPARPGMTATRPAVMGPDMTPAVPAQRPVFAPVAQIAPEPEEASSTQSDAPVAPASRDEADMQARRAQALEVLGQIVRDRQAQAPVEPAPVPARMEQAADRQAQAAQAWRAEQEQARVSTSPRAGTGGLASAGATTSAQRRPAPRGPLHPNPDLDAATEIATRSYVAQDNNRTDMQRRANPTRDTLPARSGMSRRTTLAPSDLRIELSYVGSRSEVAPRVEELKAFFPPVMLRNGRFFGASIPEQPHRFMVGIVARDAEARAALIWYLERMGMPWAIR